MQCIKQLGKWLGIAILMLIVIVILNTLSIGEFQPRNSSQEPLLIIDNEGINQRLSQAIQFKTVSTQSTADFDPLPFTDFQQWLAVNYPTVHQKSQLEVINQYSLLYTLPGSDNSLKPIILAAHIDVVPALETADSGWLLPPFSGQISDGYIWGRGAIDDKGSLIGIMEAAEYLLQSGLKPQRTLIFAFGHDEEIGGYQGAEKIAQHLTSKNIQAKFTLDEGGMLTQGIVTGVDIPVANINASEKGYATFTFSTQDAGGHSSIPPSDTAVARLARALVAVNSQRLPAEIASPVEKMLSQLAPAAPFGQRIALANLWLFEPVLLKIFSKKKTTAALTQTTVAPTVFHAGDKENVLPRSASAKVNFRLLPGVTLKSLEQHLRNVINDSSVELSLGSFQSNPSPESDTEGFAWQMLYNTTAKHFPNAVITPSLTVGATDARHYVDVSDNQYRFMPAILTPDDITGFHGKNERISLDNWHRMVRWYIDFLSTAAQGQTK